MKQLKFNHDEDIKELEKYLTKETIYGSDKKWHKDVYCLLDEDDDVEFFINEKGEIDYVQYPECIDWDNVLCKIYDLIKANLLIVEESEK